MYIVHINSRSYDNNGNHPTLESNAGFLQASLNITLRCHIFYNLAAALDQGRVAFHLLKLIYHFLVWLLSKGTISNELQHVTLDFDDQILTLQNIVLFLRANCGSISVIVKCSPLGWSTFEKQLFIIFFD